MESVAAMKNHFNNDVYSLSYNALRMIGLWSYQTNNKLKRRLFLTYQFVIMIYKVSNLSLAFAQLFIYRQDFKQISINLSTTLFAVGTMVRNVHFLNKSDSIDYLRFQLYTDRQKRNRPDEVLLKEKFKMIFVKLKKIFHAAAYIFLPFWLGSALLTMWWGPRELPFSVWIPINLDDDKKFLIAFFFQMIIGSFVTIEAVNGELGLFSLMWQISLELRTLTRNIEKIGEFYQSSMISGERNNVKRISVENEVRASLKNCIRTHWKLNKYTQLLEIHCNKSMLVQLLCTPSLMIVNGIELLIHALSRISLKLFYQMGYLAVILMDIFVICTLNSYMGKERQKLAEAVYDLPWYEMNCKLQKDILLIMIGMQLDISLTAWKFFKLDLQMFLGIIKFVGSSLTLFWQLMWK